MAEPTYEDVRRLFSYDAATGILTWNFRSDVHQVVNAHLEGKKAGTFDDLGYLRVKVFGRSFLVHRIIFLWVTGSWPAQDVDHKDMNPTNNAWSNLRSASRTSNQANTRSRATNKSGFKGVSWHKRTQKFVAQISYQNKKTHLGLFDNPQDAHNAYVAAARNLFGEFARAE